MLEKFNPRISCGKYNDEMYKKRQEFMNSNYKYKINNDSVKITYESKSITLKKLHKNKWKNPYIN